MMGFMVLGFFAVYLLMSIWAVRKAAGRAKANNRKPWLWGGIAAFIMYNLVFWDFIPTLIVHKHYCDTQAGFWIYKTPEQWKKENLTMRILSYEERGSNDYSYKKTTEGGNETSFTINKTSKIKYSQLKTPISFFTKNKKIEEILFDETRKGYLTRKISFEAGHPFGAPKTLSHYKFWINLKQCDGKNGSTDEIDWQNSVNQFMELGE